jgi:GNAT superfamily N-acetyltransferase
MTEVATISEFGLDDVSDIAGPIQQALSSWFPASTHPGGFAWEVATRQLPPEMVVARQAGVVVGWAALSDEDTRIECATSNPVIAETLVGWVIKKAAGRPVVVAVYRQHTHLRRLLSDLGFIDSSVVLPGVTLRAGDFETTPPAGYRIRPAHPEESIERVAVHRRAWKPAHLPYTDEAILRGIDPSDESRFGMREFVAMRNAPLYDPDLDLVIEAPDGSLAGNCTVWLDRASGWAEIEPLGIVPAHRRRRLAQTLALDVCRRVAERGGAHVFINSAPLPHYFAAWNTYLKAGFTPMNRGTYMARPQNA